MSYSSCRAHFFLCSSQTPLPIHSQQWFQNIDNLSGLCVPDMPFSLIENLAASKKHFFFFSAWKSRGGECEQIARNNHLYASAFLSQEASSFFSRFPISLPPFSTMVIKDGKVHRRSTITTTPPPLNPVERAYASELASLQKRVKSNPHQDYYYHDTSTTGTTPKWTLKRKRSLTKSNLQHHNKRNNNDKRSSSSSNNNKPESESESESPTAVDLISPTGQTHWSTISLSDLLATPRRSDIPDFPGKTDRHVYRDKAYKRARAGLLKSRYSPWDYVSNGALPNTACKIQSPKEKIWWKIQNIAYDRRDANGIMIREGYLTEWYFNAELGRGGVWYRQPKMLEPGPRGYLPKAWLYRWVVVARRNKGGEWWDGGIGPRDERVEIYCYDHDHDHDHALVGVDVESGKNTKATATATVVEKRSSSSSSMKKISPVLDSTGLSFCRWEKVQQQQEQHQQQLKKAPPPPPPPPNPTLPHLPNLPNPSNNNNKNNTKKPSANRKRKRKSKLVPDSIINPHNPHDLHPHPNTDDKEQPPPKRHQTHQKRPSAPTPIPIPTAVKATTSPKFHYTKEFSAEIDEAGLSIVRWRRRHHNL